MFIEPNWLANRHLCPFIKYFYYCILHSFKRELRLNFERIIYLFANKMIFFSQFFYTVRCKAWVISLSVVWHRNRGNKALEMSELVLLTRPRKAVVLRHQVRSTTCGNGKKFPVTSQGKKTKENDGKCFDITDCKEYRDS